LTRTNPIEDAGQFSWMKFTTQAAILLPLLIVIAVIQVLPQVDLPDTAFHEDTAPIVSKTRAVAAPALDVAAQHEHVTNPVIASLPVIPAWSSTARRRSSPSLPILFSALLC
jgi:hypothetical protein